MTDAIIMLVLLVMLCMFVAKWFTNWSESEAEKNEARENKGRDLQKALLASYYNKRNKNK